MPRGGIRGDPHQNGRNPSPVTAIPWTVVDPDTIERMIAVGLCRRYQHARRIRPSQGDGGLDVLVPPGQSSFHVENYQVKKFADGLNDSRKNQIKKSLKTAIATHQDTTSRYTISKWYLTLPMELTREQETWLADLAAELKAPFPVEIFGLTEIEDLLLESPNIREYYLGDGMEKVREILNRAARRTRAPARSGSRCAPGRAARRRPPPWPDARSSSRSPRLNPRRVGADGRTPYRG